MLLSSNQASLSNEALALTAKGTATKGTATKGTAQKRVVHKSIFNMLACDQHHELRPVVDDFIAKGFKSHYQASISVSMPYLIALQQGQLKAALGVRSARDTLFTQQYLDSPIVDILAKLEKGVFQHSIEAHQVAEIGHLYSNAKMFTLPLMLVTAVTLHMQGFRYMVFTGTEHLIQLIEKTGVDVHLLANANQARLIDSTQDWGTYYDTQPKVAAISLSQVLQVIDSDLKLNDMFQALATQIAKVAHQLSGL